MKTFREFLTEGRAFEYQGSRYSSFGKYYKRDGESISKEEYQKASEAYKNRDSLKQSKQKDKVDLTPKKINSTKVSFSSLSQNIIPSEHEGYYWSEKGKDNLDNYLADDSKNEKLRKFLEEKTKLNLTGEERLYKWCHSYAGDGIGKYGMKCINFLLKNETRVRRLEKELDSNNIDKDDYVSTMTEKLKTYTANASMTIRCSVGSLMKIVNDNKFKTQFETGTTGGGLDIAGRSNIELMGQNVKYSIDNSKRPVYGCLKQRNSDGSVNIDEYDNDSQYGDCVCVLKDNLRDKTTVCFGDSKDDYLYSSPLDNPDFKSFLGLGEPYGLIMNNYKDVTNKEISELFEYGDLKYPEIQIHDTVTTQEIDYVVITSGKRKKANKELIKKLEAAGIKYVIQEKK
jgi:hypothetical protein